MRIAITGGTGFVGGHLARRLAAGGHEAVVLARRADGRAEALSRVPGVRVVQVSLDDEAGLRAALDGADAVAHCAGINRELGPETYARVHVEGTQRVVAAAHQAGVRRLALMSFLRARPGCGSAYHESKWQAEEIVRGSRMDWAVLKCGVIHGRGDHMLDHLSHALHSFPVFGLVGLKERPVAPVAVADVTRILEAALVEGRLSRRSLAIIGPETMPLGEAVRRVARVVGADPLFVRLPVVLHRGLAWVAERLMVVPLVSQAQVRILAEGVVEPGPLAEPPPGDLRPATRFDDEAIRLGLPAPGPFGLEDLRCCARPRAV